MKKMITLVLAAICFLSAVAQKSSIEDYILQYRNLAIEEMKRTGVPAAIKLAQGIHETEAGNSDLVKRSNNHFGIKCKTGWNGEFVFHDDDASGECFRKYPSANASYTDHSDFLKRSSRYNFLFQLKPTDYKGWAYGLKKAGYATNPKYPLIIIKYIEEYNLQAYTQMALEDKLPDPQEGVATTSPATISDDSSTARVAVADDDRMGSTYSGKTLFNGLRAVWAKAGTSLLAIATEHDIALSRLLDFNDLEHDGLLTHDEWIYLERKRKAGKQVSYVTEDEISQRDIAQLNAIQLHHLISYNAFEEGKMVGAGTTVYLQPVQAVKKADAASAIIHEVQPKEGLYAISRKYQVPVKDIKTLNKLESDQLTVGQKLIISK